jgi:uncharacterized OB-fold protein
MTERPAKPAMSASERMHPFWDAARERRLVLPRCRGCGKLDFPVPETCRHCLDRDFDWLVSSGRGAVYSFVVMHQVYDPAFARRVPYAVVTVELEEGPRIISNLVDCEPSAIRVGMAVAVAFESLGGEAPLPVFRPT